MNAVEKVGTNNNITNVVFFLYLILTLKIACCYKKIFRLFLLSDNKILSTWYVNSENNNNNNDMVGE